MTRVMPSVAPEDKYGPPSVITIDDLPSQAIPSSNGLVAAFLA
jgi:hypothetical protein